MQRSVLVQGSPKPQSPNFSGFKVRRVEFAFWARPKDRQACMPPQCKAGD